MPLPWFRMDTNIFSHDKILWLIDQPQGWKAYAVWTFSIAWSAGHSTDGVIPTHALRAINGDKKTTALLLACHLWEPHERGWKIRNFEQRQETSDTSEKRKAAASAAGRKSACVRNHSPGCECWAGGTVLPMQQRRTP